MWGRRATTPYSPHLLCSHLNFQLHIYSATWSVSYRQTGLPFAGETMIDPVLKTTILLIRARYMCHFLHSKDRGVFWTWQARSPCLHFLMLLLGWVQKLVARFVSRQRIFRSWWWREIGGVIDSNLYFATSRSSSPFTILPWSIFVATM